MSKKTTKKNLTILITSFILLTLSPKEALTTVTPLNPLPSPQLLPKDIWSKTLQNDIFDTSKAAPPLEFSSTIGKTFNSSEFFFQKHYEILKLKNLNFIKKLENSNLVAGVFDKVKILVQEINNNGQKFENYVFADLTNFGDNKICSDFLYNLKRNFLYIGCFDQNTSELNPGSLAIHTLDLNTKNITSSAVVKQDDGFRILNRLSMFIGEFPQGASNDDPTHLIVYDQGHTSQNFTKEAKMARNFFNVNSGDLTFSELLNFDIGAKNLEIIYDIYPYFGQIVLTCRIKEIGDIVTLSLCKLDLQEAKIFCNEKVKASNVKHGKVSLDSKGFYTEVDILMKELRFYRLRVDSTTLNWNFDLIKKMENLVLKEKEDLIWIREVATNEWSSVIQYGQKNNADPGVGLLDWASKKNNFYYNHSADLFDRNWVIGDTNNPIFSLLRNDAFFLIDTHYLKFGDNEVSITAKDSQNSAKVSTRFTLLNSIFEKIYLKNKIGQIEMNSHQTLDIEIKEEEIIAGNGINVKIESENEEVVKGVGITHLPVRIILNNTEISSGDFYFTGNRVLVKSNIGRVIWARCSQIATIPLTYNCSEDGSYPFDVKNEKLLDKIKGKGNTLVAISNSDTGAAVYLMNDQGEYKRFKFNNEVVKDFTLIRTSTFLYPIVVFKRQVIVYYIDNLSQLKIYEIFDENSVNFGSFCPVGAEVSKDSQDEFDILSNCGRGDSAVYRWGLTYNTPHIRIPIDSNTYPSKFCSFKSEFMIRGNGNLYTISNLDDFSRFNVPLESLNLNSFEIYCLGDIEKLVIIGNNGNNDKNHSITVILGNEGENQLRRYRSVITGIIAEDIKSFDFMGRAIHVIENGDKREMIVTLDTPILRFSSGEVKEETDVAVKISFFNFGTEQTFYQYVTVYPHQKGDREEERF